MKKAACIIALFVIPFVLYRPNLEGAFHYDDIHHIVENKAILSLKNIPKFFTNPGTFSNLSGVEMYRPALMTTYALNYRIGGFKPEGWHLFGMFLHAVNAALLFSIAGRLLRNPAPAFIAALLFAAHPVAGESVNYISSRSSLLLTTFFLAAFASYQRALEPKIKRAWPWLAAAHLFFALSLFSKETAIVFPALIALYEWLFPREGEPSATRLRKAALRITPAVCIAALYIAARKLMMNVVLSPVQARPVWQNMLTETKAYFFYLKALFIPTGMSVDYDFHAETSIASPLVLLAIAGLILSIAIFIALAGRNETGSRLLAFCIAWYALSLLPTSSIVPLSMFVNMRRPYLALPAFAIALSMLYPLLKPGIKRRVGAAMFGFILAAFAALVFARNPAWTTQESIWRDAYRKAPGNPRVLRGMADYYFLTMELENSLRLYRKAALLEPDNSKILQNIALTLDMLGRSQEALPIAKKAYEMSPNNMRINFTLGNVYEHTGSVELARFHIEKAIRIEPDFALSHNNLGRIFELQGDPEKAEQEYRIALSIEPDNELPNYNLGLMLLKRGNPDQALQYLMAAYRANPGYEENSFQVGLCFARLKKWPESKQYFMKAVEINPRFSNAWYNLGLVERILGNTARAEAAFRRAGKNPPH